MMQRKSSFPVANSRIKMPDAMPLFDITVFEDDDQQKKRQQLINFGHSQWGFNNWSWSVSKQDLDFVDFSNGKYVVGVVAFVSITVKSFDIHRENIGYATTTAPMKGSAIYQARKGAVTNALRETLLSFGGNVAIELMDLLEPNKHEAHNPAVSGAPDLLPENNQNLANKPTNEVKNINKPMLRKESVDVAAPNPVTTVNKPHPNINTVIPKVVVPPPPPPVAKAHPMPANLPPAANKPFPPAAANQRVPPPAPHPRPNSNSPAKAAAPSFEGMTEEEARAERKRRQRVAQEEFQRKLKQKADTDGERVDKAELHKSGFDTFLMDIPTQDIVIEETGTSVDGDRKRKSPEPGNVSKRRGGVINRLDTVTDGWQCQ